MKIKSKSFRNLGVLLIKNPTNKFYLITSLSFVSDVKLYSSLTKAERSKLVLDESQKSILIGLLLGDAHINKRSLTGNSRLIYGQSALRAQHVSYFYFVFMPYGAYSNLYVPQRSLLKLKLG